MGFSSEGSINTQSGYLEARSFEISSDEISPLASEGLPLWVGPRNNCFPLSTIHAPARHDTRGEGETTKSGSSMLLQSNLSFPIVADTDWHSRAAQTNSSI
uniref:Uncharacterized protein n=1 Tax=Oryza rufipogon TaxID=4529 RepID=A0A0E0PQC5_ORYRU